MHVSNTHFCWFILYLNSPLTWMSFEVTVTFSKLIIYSNLVLSPTASVLSVPEPAMYFPFGKHSSVFSTCLLFTRFLCSSKSYPSFKVQFEFLRTFSASVDLYPQRALCQSAPQLFLLCFPFSSLFFLFSILSSYLWAEQQISLWYLQEK